MKPDGKQRTEKGCTCGRGGGLCERKHGRRLVLDRRRFLAFSSGCIVGALGAATGKAAEKSSSVDIGKLKDFAEDGIAEAFVKNGFFVIRREGRLIAASTICPHQGNMLRRDHDDPGRIICGGHDSAFDSEGKVLVGPATTGLVRLSISVNGEGRVMVNPSEEFPQDNWADKKCSIEIK